MDTNTEFYPDCFEGTVTSDGFAHPIGRKLRSFDVDGCAPYEYPGMVAFLKAWKLADLSTKEIQVFLLLRDNPDPKGYTIVQIARWLGMSALSAWFCLVGLKRKGYALPSSIAHQEDRGKKTRSWVVNGSSEWADDDALFWGFGYLM